MAFSKGSAERLATSRFSNEKLPQILNLEKSCLQTFLKFCADIWREDRQHLEVYSEK